MTPTHRFRTVLKGSIASLSACVALLASAEPVGTSNDLVFSVTEGVTYQATPKEIRDTMYRNMVAAMNQPDLKRIWAEQGADAGGMPPEEFAKLVRSEIVKWGKVVKESGAQVDS